MGELFANLPIVFSARLILMLFIDGIIFQTSIVFPRLSQAYVPRNQTITKTSDLILSLLLVKKEQVETGGGGTRL